jgi:hypothetical protein
MAWLAGSARDDYYQGTFLAGEALSVAFSARGGRMRRHIEGGCVVLLLLLLLLLFNRIAGWWGEIERERRSMSGELRVPGLVLRHGRAYLGT